MLPRTLEPEVMDTPEEAIGYDRMDHSIPNENFVNRLIELGARGTMLDIGTGPGHIPLLVCRRIPAAVHVTGLDLSAEMLKLAEARRLASPHAGRIAFRRGDAKGLPFPDASFDAVFSNTILHHIPDPRPFVAEAWRVVKPGGAFLIRDLFRPDSRRRIEELVALHAADADDYQKQLFRQSFHAALTPAEFRALAADLGLLRAGCEVVIDTDRHMSLQRRQTAP